MIDGRLPPPTSFVSAVPWPTRCVCPDELLERPRAHPRGERRVRHALLPDDAVGTDPVEDAH